MGVNTFIAIGAIFILVVLVLIAFGLTWNRGNNE